MILKSEGVDRGMILRTMEAKKTSIKMSDTQISIHDTIC